MTVVIAGNMEPSAGIDKSWVPALQHMGWVRESASQSVQSISFRVGGERRGEEGEEEREEEREEGGVSHCCIARERERDREQREKLYGKR